MANIIRVRAGQEWELAMGNSDPLVMRVVSIHPDGLADVQTIKRSAPNVILNSGRMWPRDVMDSGILVAGPGAAQATTRRARIAHIRDLLLYDARRMVTTSGRDVRVDGEEIISITRDDYKVSRDEARALIRDGLATLGGTETMKDRKWPEWGYRVVYVIPERCCREGEGSPSAG